MAVAGTSVMYGPDILVRSLSYPYKPDAYGNSWQYHPRSDRHSKIACWGIMFDLLRHSELLRDHVADGKVIFGINHEMSDFANGRKKALDLVIARPGPTSPAPSMTFDRLALNYGLLLSEEQSEELRRLPLLYSGPVGSVLLALEAKACMTEHSKAMPRLHDELDSSQKTIRGADPDAVSVGFAMVNVARSFISPGMNKFNISHQQPKVTQHKQPYAAANVVDMLKSQMKTRFDAFGIAVIDCPNDGSRIDLVKSPPAPAAIDDFHYDHMIWRARHRYEMTFAKI
jgi:hypothetical protein